MFVVVSFIGGGNRRKPPTTCRKSLKTETFFVDIKQPVYERVQFNLAYLTKKSTDTKQQRMSLFSVTYDRWSVVFSGFLHQYN
jgi:hypothetical protein